MTDRIGLVKAWTRGQSLNGRGLQSCAGALTATNKTWRLLSLLYTGKTGSGQCQPRINKPPGCLIREVPFKYHIVTIWGIPPK